MAVVDIICALTFILFVIADFLRGAIRVLGGILAFITAVIATYFGYSYGGSLVLQFWDGNLTLANILGGFCIFCFTEILGLFFYPYLLRKFFLKLDALEKKGIQMADEEAQVEERKEQGKAKPHKASSSAEDELEEMGDELEISLMERVLGAFIGGVKALVLIFGIFFFLHALPTPELILKKVKVSFFGKVYAIYLAKPLEKRYPTFKIMNNLGNIVEIGQKIQENPEALDRIKQDRQVQKLMSIKAVKDFIKSEKEFLQWAKEHPWEAYHHRKVQKLLQNPAVKRELSEIDFQRLKQLVK